MNPNHDDIDRRSIVLSIICTLLIMPLAFHLMISDSETISKDLLAFISVTILSVVFALIAKGKINPAQIQSRPNVEKRTSNKFNVFTSTNFNNIRDKHANLKRKMNSRYLKPNYIVNELMSMWSTTYTVITFSSAWVFGSTICATERLARKIRNKYQRDGQQNLRSDSFSSNDSQLFDDFSSSDDRTYPGPGEKVNLLTRMSSWTKRSFSSFTRKFGKIVTPGPNHINKSISG